MKKSGIIVLLFASLIFLAIFSCDEEEILKLDPVDKIPPKVSIIFPAVGATVSDTATVQVTASDEYGIRYVSIFIDSKEMTDSRDSLEPFEFSWNTLICEDKSNHEIKAFAIDKNKNSAYSEPVKCVVDNNIVTKPPEVYIVKPGDGAIVSGEVIVKAKCFSDEAIERVELMIDGQLLEGSADYKEPYEFEWSTFKFEDNTEYKLRASAFTVSGTPGVSESVNCMINNSEYYPEEVTLYEVVFEENTFIVSWSQSQEDNFLRYVLYESTNEQLSDEDQIFETNSISENQFEVINIAAGEKRYYRILVENDLNFSTFSNVEMGEAAYEIPHGLRAYWPFKGNAKDASEYDHDGVVYGAELTTDRLGNPASAYYFDGYSYIEIPEHSDMNLEHGYTLAAWINPEYFNLYNNIISRVNPNRDFVMQLNDVKLAAHIWPSSGFCWIYAPDPVPQDKWTHVAVTFKNSIWKVYVNGEPVNTRDCTGMMPPWTGTIMLIGAMNYVENFTGSIDEVMVFERALTDDEVAILPLIQ